LYSLISNINTEANIYLTADGFNVLMCR